MAASHIAANKQLKPRFAQALPLPRSKPPGLTSKPSFKRKKLLWTDRTQTLRAQFFDLSTAHSYSPSPPPAPSLLARLDHLPAPTSPTFTATRTHSPTFQWTTSIFLETLLNHLMLTKFSSDVEQWLSPGSLGCPSPCRARVVIGGVHTLKLPCSETTTMKVLS